MYDRIDRLCSLHTRIYTRSVSLSKLTMSADNYNVLQAAAAEIFVKQSYYFLGRLSVAGARCRGC